MIALLRERERERERERKREREGGRERGREGGRERERGGGGGGRTWPEQVAEGEHQGVEMEVERLKERYSG